MAREGWFITERHGRESLYRLTERGTERLRGAARRLFDPAPPLWDGKLRALVGTPGSITPAVRRELGWLGFRPVAAHAWVSPLPQEAEAMEAFRRRGLGEPWLFLSDWPPEEVGRVRDLYDWAIIRAAHEQFRRDLSRPGERPVGASTCEAAFVERIELVHHFRKLLFVDPGLPRVFEPSQAEVWQAWPLFHARYRALEAGVAEYLRAVWPEPAFR
jgi:phenylacetic acid degradation operon negative regulatory protein